MKKVATAVVTVLILFAGCSGGPLSGENSTAASTPEVNMSQPDNPKALAGNGSSSSVSGLDSATKLNATLYNGTTQGTMLIESNQTAGTTLYKLNASGYTTALYNTSEYAAFQNSTTGEVEYGEPGSIGSNTAFASFYYLGAGSEYADIMMWEPAGTAWVNDNAAFVYESDSLNESVLAGRQRFITDIQQENVESVDGRMMISPDGEIYAVNVDIKTADNNYGIRMTFRYDSMTNIKPSWVDESKAP
jgi:hypothetical protein